MVQGVHRALDEEDVPLGVDVVAEAPEAFRDVLDVHFPVEDHDDLAEHHLPEAPEGAGHLAGVAGVALVDGDEGEIVEDPLHGEVYVHHLGEGLLDEGEEEPFGGLGQVAVLLRGAAHDGGGVDGVPPHGHAGHVEDGVVVREGVVAGVVPEGALKAPLPGLDVTLKDDLALSRDLKGHGEALHELNRPSPQETGKEHLVKVVRERGGGGVGDRRVRPDGHRHRKPLAKPFGHPEVLGPALVEVPVHPGGVAVKDLHAVHAGVSHPGLRVFGDHHRKRDEGPPVLGPAVEDRKPPKVHLFIFKDDLLAGGLLDQLGEDVGQALELGDQVELLDDGVRGLDLKEVQHVPGKLVQVLDPQGQAYAAEAPEHVGDHG